LKNQKQTIRKIVGFLNNKESDGGFWLPNIQRPFVWSEGQICRLFDSIMREYPISTFLIWKTTSPIRRRSFIDNWKDSLRLSDFYQTEDRNRKCLVLDGQQRLQSLFIGLRGSYNGKELYFDVLSGELAAPDDIKFRFRFQSPESAIFPWVRFKDLVFTEKRKRELIEDITAAAGRELNQMEMNKIEDHLDLVDRTFKMEETIAYQELDSIDTPKLYSDDDVVEVFIRANSGGTRLGKSDLLFSLLSSSWDEADERMEFLLESLNRYGFDFNRDFVLKTCLVLLDQAARYEVSKFRNPGVRNDIQNRWDEIASAIQDVLDFVRSKTYIRCDKALPSNQVLIPLAYLRFHYKDAWRRASGVDIYLLRCLLGAAFTGQPDTVIDGIVRRFRDLKAFDLSEVFGAIRSANRSLEITEEKLFQMGYASDTIHLLFNLWYKDFNHTPAYENNRPQIDHIFPQSALQKIKDVNPETGRKDVFRYHKSTRDQLANCMLLTREENGAGGKGDTLPADWFANKPDDYLNRHLIPKDRELWALERFDDFVEARKALIREKFRFLLATPSED